MGKLFKMPFLTIMFSSIFLSQTYGFDLTEKFSVSGTVTGVYQLLDKSKGDVKNRNRGSGVIDFNLSFRPNENDEFFMRSSFAKGDGLKKVNPFSLLPNADDLSGDLHDINGHARDHLQELWYAHVFNFDKNKSLKLTGGIIDSTCFIDDNIYAADELHQFMNEALVHNPLANLPSYDIGIALQFETRNLDIRILGMNQKNEYKKHYIYFGTQIGYKWENILGKGTYRLYGFVTNRKFLKWDEEGYSSLKGIGLSFDQELIKDIIGTFFRAGWQDDSAQVDHNRMISFGLNLSGSLWGRNGDEIGVGYCYLKSPSGSEISRSQVFEGYIKFKLFSYKALCSDFTVDYQFIQDKYRVMGKRAGNIYGLRFNINF